MGRAVFFNVPTSGHVNPSLPLVAELVARGEDITVMLTEPYRAKVEATGARFQPYPADIVPDDFFEREGLDGGNPPHSARYLIQTSEKLLAALLPGLRENPPDYVLYDVMCPWGNLIGQALKVPRIESMCLLFVDPALLLRQAGVTRVAGMMARGAGHLAAHAVIARRIARAHGVKALSFPETLLNPADLIISFTSAEFQPNAAAFGEHVRYVGPSIAPRNETDAFLLSRLTGVPLVYVSLGTVINDNLPFFRACIEAFRTWQVQVVMSLGRHIRPRDLGPLPDNVIALPFVPQIEILERAALFVTHGGMNSVHEGLYFGVPLLAVPQTVEQRGVAWRVHTLGAGLVLGDRSPTAEQIRAAATRIFEQPSFRQAAESLRDSFRRAGGQARGADEILKFLADRQSS
jgi:MGT family glycosyltransferase